MNPFKSLAVSAAFASLVLHASSAVAATWFEAPPGAGETLLTAQHVVGSGQAITEIRGTLDTVLKVDSTPRNQVDLYRIFISDFASFSARTLSSDPDDTALFLFDRFGKGVYTNDDTTTNLLSFLPSGGPLANDFYFLGVSVGGFTALDAGSINVFLSGSFTDVLGRNPTSGALASFDEGFATLSEAGLAYDIVLTGVLAPVPEPETVLLMLLGFAGLFASKSVRRSARAVRSSL